MLLIGKQFEKCSLLKPNCTNSFKIKSFELLKYFCISKFTKSSQFHSPNISIILNYGKRGNPNVRATQKSQNLASSILKKRPIIWKHAVSKNKIWKHIWKHFLETFWKHNFGNIPHCAQDRYLPTPNGREKSILQIFYKIHYFVLLFVYFSKIQYMLTFNQHLLTKRCQKEPLLKMAF